jgi:hypothetical protein
MLTVAGFAIASAVQAGCSGHVDPGPTASTYGGLTCSADQTAEQLGAHAVCCTGVTTGRLSCIQPGEVAAGMPCTTAGATTQGDGFEVILDQCVTESCTGDRIAGSYPRQTTRQQGLLVCQGGAWQWQGATAQHVVVRSCLVTSQAACSESIGYGNEAEYFTGYGYYGYYAYWGSDPYSYAYYSGPVSVPVRTVQVSSSTCTDAQRKTSLCDAGDL